MEQKHVFPDYVVLESDNGQRLLDEWKDYNNIMQQNSLLHMSMEEEGIL